MASVLVLGVPKGEGSVSAPLLIVHNNGYEKGLEGTGKRRDPIGGFDRLRAGVLGYEKVHQLYVGGCHAKLYKGPCYCLQ